MGGRRRQRPGAGGAGRPARRAANSGDQAGRRTGTPDQPAQRAGAPGEPSGRRAMRALNPRKAPTRSRARMAALTFAALAIVLGVLGLTVNRGYLQPAVLLAILALLWGGRALTMR